jgi:hypothetical protein
MKTFNDLEFKADTKYGVGGIKALMAFDNGYGVSVIRNAYSYGGDEGLYELTVMDKTLTKFIYCDLTYRDVLGYLEPDEVSTVMRKIQEAKPGELEDDDDC